MILSPLFEIIFFIFSDKAHSTIFHIFITHAASSYISFLELTSLFDILPSLKYSYRMRSFERSIGGFLLQRDCPEEQSLIFAYYSHSGEFYGIEPTDYSPRSHCLSTGWHGLPSRRRQYATGKGKRQEIPVKVRLISPPWRAGFYGALDKWIYCEQTRIYLDNIICMYLKSHKLLNS